MLKILSRLIDFITWVVSFLLLARFVMLFFQASQTAPFVDWLYAVSSDLMTPFRGMFPRWVMTRGNVVELTSLIAAIIYAIVGYAISAFIDSVADHLSFRRKDSSVGMQSPNPTPPSVTYQQPVNQPIGLDGTESANPNQQNLTQPLKAQSQPQNPSTQNSN